MFVLNLRPEPHIPRGSRPLPAAGALRVHAVHRIPAERGGDLHQRWRKQLRERVRAHSVAFTLGAAASRSERSAAAPHAFDCTLATRMAYAIHASLTRITSCSILLSTLNDCVYSM